jgi:CRP-like cAMP-binding protein
MQRTFSVGDVIVEKDAFVPGLFIVVRGRVKFEGERVGFFLSDGDVFGEEGVFLDKPSPFNLIAAEETIVEVLNKSEAEKYCIDNPKILFSLFVKNVSRLWGSYEKFSKDNEIYIKLIETILPFVKERDGEHPVHESQITVDKLSAKTKTSRDQMFMILSAAENLKQIKISGGNKIKTTGSKDLLLTIENYYKNRYFRGTNPEGAGKYTLLKSFRSEKRKNVDR